jgi:hypothetical protein
MAGGAFHYANSPWNSVRAFPHACLSFRDFWPCPFVLVWAWQAMRSVKPGDVQLAYIAKLDKTSWLAIKVSIEFRDKFLKQG